MTLWAKKEIKPRVSRRRRSSRLLEDGDLETTSTAGDARDGEQERWDLQE